MNDDEGLVASIARDPDALEAFYREHVGAVGRFVARRVDDPHWAADLTTDIFLAAVDAAESYRPSRGTPTGWLYGIARNVLADQVRRRARERAALQRAGGRRHLEGDALARIEERIDAERELREVYRALAELPERDRRVIELVALDGLTVTDAAAVLGVKPATARVRLHRSRARVDQLIQAAACPPPIRIQEATS
ncbi:RNA polymerase sigma factor [Nocardioides carbamazepini]|jgi:RNA polymerase sigma factor (sigma-70 family)|uniref:RNA polymerase sigma factor n=1 Tax=Nocardioides carbamazepini TaxID=2854259 RepID=UPI002149D00E|nr:RNA polymerase sigma factor [Nocardioides carbamazepini]MCR1781936.1 RNA polymerase sigma factor [Nocardioides carbamazepini]